LFIAILQTFTIKAPRESERERVKRPKERKKEGQKGLVLLRRNSSFRVKNILTDHNGG
jgi:hypothetical protein